MISFDSRAGFPEKYYSKQTLSDWLVSCAAHHQHIIKRLSYQFCNEKTMLQYNQEYLQHDYFTDILTFPETQKTNPIKGDVLINIDRLVDNANRFDVPVEKELLRLLAHGLLHLCGFRDYEVEDKKEMTAAEDWCIDHGHLKLSGSRIKRI